MPKKKASESASIANIGFEYKLGLATYKLCNNMDATEYKHAILGLIFLKYISDCFEEHHAKLTEGKGDFAGANPGALDKYKVENFFGGPKGSQWSHLQSNAKRPTIGELVDDAKVAIERDNSGLEGVLPKDFASPELDRNWLGELTNLIGTIALRDSENQSKDVLGRVYDYCFTQFASDEGKNEGLFNSPSCVVRRLVEMLETYKGPQSEKFLASHGGKLADIGIYGQESDATTRRLAALDFVLLGIETDFGPVHADTSLRDLHPDLRADYALANPLFNNGDWFHRYDDVRWAYFIPPKLSANFAWVMRFINRLSPQGMTGFLLANGSMPSNQSGEGNIRWALVKADLIEGRIALPGQIFYHRQIRVCMWFPARNKNDRKLGDRREQMLFTDVRKPNHPCRDLAHVGTERTDGTIQDLLGDNGGTESEYTFHREIHHKAA